jgi:hypothetical protein
VDLKNISRLFFPYRLRHATPVSSRPVKTVFSRKLIIKAIDIDRAGFGLLSMSEYSEFNTKMISHNKTINFLNLLIYLILKGIV